MRRLEQNGEILTKALLVSGLVIGTTTIMGIQPVTRTGENYDFYYAEGNLAGKTDCDKGLSYNPSGREDSNQQGFKDGYQDGWAKAGCSLDSSKDKK